MKRIAIIPLLLISTAGIIFLANKKKTADTSNQEYSISSCSPELREITVPINTYGTVTYKTKNDVTSLESGTVIKKLVKEGDAVKKGQPLYILKNLELEIQQSQYQNNLNSAKANLELSKAKLFEKEQDIRSHLLLIQNKKSELEKLNITLNKAEENLTTSTELNLLGGVSDKTLKDMNTEIEIIKTNISILQRELESALLGFSENDLISNGITPAHSSELLQNQLIALNTRTAIADVDVAHAGYINAEKNLQLVNNLINNLTISSPVSGIVGAMYFENGEYVKQNDIIVTIIDISTCQASVSLQEDYIHHIATGYKTSLEIPALQMNIDSVVNEISPIADSSTGNFFIKTFFENPELSIKPGMFIRCKIYTPERKQLYCIPETALFNITEKKAECFSIKNNIAVPLVLNLSHIENGIAFIESGLSEKDSIITSPSAQIKEGTRVKTS